MLIMLIGYSDANFAPFDSRLKNKLCLNTRSCAENLYLTDQYTSLSEQNPMQETLNN